MPHYQLTRPQCPKTTTFQGQDLDMKDLTFQD